MFVFGLHSTSDDWPSDLSKKCWPKCKKNKKGPLSHQKITCSFLDYVQLLMISQAVRAQNINQKAKKKPKRPPKSLKNKMFVFGLCSTSNDLPNDPSKKCWPKCKKNKKGPLSHQKITCSFLDYVQLLMISQAVRAQNINQKAKKNQKGPLSHWKIKCSFLYYVQLLMICQTIRAKNVDQTITKWKSPLSHQK